MSRLYFVSEHRMDGVTLEPRIPQNFLTKHGYEDNTTKRVCFSTSIDGCLIALSQNIKGKIFYVHEPLKKPTSIKVPTKKQVPDVTHTHEVWVTEPVTLKVTGKIVVKDAKPKELHYFYGDNREAILYGWNYTAVHLEKLL